MYWCLTNIDIPQRDNDLAHCWSYLCSSMIYKYTSELVSSHNQFISFNKFFLYKSIRWSYLLDKLYKFYWRSTTDYIAWKVSFHIPSGNAETVLKLRWNKMNMIRWKCKDSFKWWCYGCKGKRSVLRDAYAHIMQTLLTSFKSIFVTKIDISN